LARLLPTLVSVALLAGCAAAFAIAERLKLRPSPILGPKIERTFSPGCRCPHPSADLSFRLPKPDRVSVTVVDAAGRPVRHLVTAASLPRGHVLVQWNGRDDAGALVGTGTYRYRLALARAGRTIALPFGVTADRTRPTVHVISALPPSLRAGQGSRAGRVKIRYRLSERARPLIVFRGRVVVRGHRQRPRGALDWYARAAGKALAPGVYRLALVAQDPAGNRSVPAFVTVRIRAR
jgi:FlgD Ig-like domain